RELLRWSGHLLDLEQPALDRAAMGDHEACRRRPPGELTLASNEAASVEVGRLLFAQPTIFVRGVAGLDQLPIAELPEVALAGRSNVGKSSLVNVLTGRTALARTSNTPGRTQELNFFALGDRLMLVDLPGYGYARAPRDKADAWTRLVVDYLRGRPSLRRVLV